MCGRFALYSEPARVAQQLDASIDQASFDGWRPSWNIAPTQQIIGVGEISTDGPAGTVRRLQRLRWGLIGPWVTDLSKVGATFNARAETVATKPTFRSAFKRRRILVPADLYFEWKKGPGVKQPYVIRRADGALLAFAGLAQPWRPPDEPDHWLQTATVITAPAGSDTAELHDRQPVVLEPALFDAWLDPTNDDTDELQAMLTAAVPGTLIHYPVDRRVGNVQNNDAACVAPIGAP